MLPLTDAMINEILVAALLVPMAQANLPAEILRTISMSDASEQGRASAEWLSIWAAFDQHRSAEVQDIEMSTLDRDPEPRFSTKRCARCKRVDVRQLMGSCPIRCGSSGYSSECLQRYESSCRDLAIIVPEVVVPDLPALQLLR